MSEPVTSLEREADDQQRHLLDKCERDPLAEAAISDRGVVGCQGATAATDVLHAAEVSLLTHPGESDGDFRAALDKHIEQDVSTGTMTREDATKLKKALDHVTGTSDSGDAGADDTDDVQAAAAGPGGGRGAGEAVAAGLRRRPRFPA